MSNLDNNTPPPKCFAHHHMTPAEYGFWDVCRSLSHESGVLFFDGRKMAQRFRSTSKSTMYRMAESLTARGWLRLVKPSTRLPNGTKSPSHYKILSHADWIAEHPNECFSPVPSEGLVENSLSQNQVSLSQNQVSLSQNQVSLSQNQVSLSQNERQPVPSEGHNLIVNLINTTDIDTKPVPSEGLVEVDALIHRFSKIDRATKKNLRQEAEAKAGLVPEGAPVPSEGLAVRDTHVEAERLATAIVNELEMHGEGYKTEWRKAMQYLLSKGNSPDKIRKLFDYTKDRFGAPTVKLGGKAFIEHIDTIVSEYRQHIANKTKEVSAS